MVTDDDIRDAFEHQRYWHARRIVMETLAKAFAWVAMHYADDVRKGRVRP